MCAGEKHPYDPANTELATKFTVGDYEKARDSKDRDKIAKGIQRRFDERYLTPISGKNTHGFTIMAVSCLMIEALESLREGRETTEGKSLEAFRSFFDHADQFSTLRGHAQGFYKHVRCAILHQAETTGGWRIRRDDSPLFDSENLTVNARRFVVALRRYLTGFCNELRSVPWDDLLWKRVRRKMDAIAWNCRKATRKTN